MFPLNQGAKLVKKELFRLTLYAIIAYLTGSTLNPAVAVTHPLGRNRTHFCGVIDYQSRLYRDSKQPGNRNYARTFAANLNVGQPRTVRMIYFLPNDRPYRAEVVQKMKDDILKIQTFFAEQMEVHGYGKLTFRVETDSQGKPIVHRVNGRRPDSHYLDYTEDIVIDEIEQTFNFYANIYLVVVDNSINALGGGAYGLIGGEAGSIEVYEKQGGYGIVHGGFNWKLVAHELGHAFGLWHDLRDDFAYIMSWHPRRHRLSACHAAFLAVHPYFNPDSPVEKGAGPTIELISSRSYPTGSQNVPVRFRISDSTGLQWGILFIDGQRINGAPEVKACRGLQEKKEVEVEFNYDGVIPPNSSTNLSNLAVHPIRFEAIDTDGNVSRFRFILFSEALQPLSKISGDNQHGLPNTPLPVPFVVELRDLNNGFPRHGVWVTFTVTAGGGLLSRVRIETDRFGRAESTLTLGPNFGTNTVEVSAEGETLTFTAVAVAAAEIPDPNLRAAIEGALGRAPGTPIAPAEIATLTRLEARNAGISDLTGLEYATNLEILELGGESVDGEYVNSNTIADLSPLMDLTNLTQLNLWGNNISDISAVAGLINLKSLYLGWNNISDSSVVADLTNLTELGLEGNNISDISAVAGLTKLTWLNLGANSILDVSGVADLTKLTWLNLGSNNVLDVSVLANLTQLKTLYLWRNNISDISPLVENAGLGSGDEVDLRGNPLSYVSIYTHIPTLQSRGVAVEFNTRKVERPLKISGDNQQGTVGAVLTDPFIVEVRDRNGAVFAGVPVTFAVTAGGGTLSVTSTTTNENGRAQTTLMLGTNRGTNSVAVSAAGTEGQVSFNAISNPLTTEYLWSIPVGTSLIHVPLKVSAVDGVAKTIRSIGDLYDVLGGASTVNFLITYDPSTQGWLSYFGASDRGSPGDKVLTDDTGVVAGIKLPVSVLLTGEALGIDGNSTITLNPGLNVVGLPLNDSSLLRVSDLFALDGIGGNASVIILTEVGEFKAVGRAGDPGDIEITGGQGFILNAQRAAKVAISGDGWYNVSGSAAAPLVGNADLHSLRTGITGGNTTPVLALSGSIVEEGTGLKVSNFRVIVKNLSAGRAVAAVTTPDKVGYRSTVVDIETGRAATVGDILEIFAQSPSPFIGVQPLQYTVTTEDVKRSLIQLPALVAYEIPTETELLRNYPNPFNPETWIPYRLAEDAFVTLTIYDLNGQVVRTLEVGHQIAAVYESRSKAIYWDGRNEVGEQVASGIYFYYLSAGDYSATRKMLILK